MNKVVVGISGGIDSAFVAYTLKEQGFDVRGVFLHLFGEIDSFKMRRIRKICEIIDIPLSIKDCADSFSESIVNPFMKSYLSGITPNPCIICNAKVKFKFLLDVADSSCCPFVASGHYAKVSKSEEGRFRICRGDDAKKDQSYMLYRLRDEWFPRLLLPLGSLTKVELKRRAAAVFGGIFKDERESQDICFIGNQDYTDFIMNQINDDTERNGSIIDMDGKVLGEYHDFFRYTIGQRKGLGLSGGPWFVLSIDPIGRKIVVGPEEKLFSSVVNCVSPVWHDKVHLGEVLYAQHRYRTHPVEVRISSLQEDGFSVDVLGKMRSPAPGQSMVLYRGNEVIGGGIITSAEE